MYIEKNGREGALNSACLKKKKTTTQSTVSVNG